MEEYKETLDEMINLLVSGDWSVSKFKAEFYCFYLKEVPTEVQSENEWLFYSTIHQSLDSIPAEPDVFSEQASWNKKYIEWVLKQREHFIGAIEPI